MLFGERRIEVRVTGGLGNQLFGYFAGLHLSGVSGRKLVLNMKEASRSHSLYDLRSFSEVSELRIVNNSLPRIDFVKKIFDSLRYRLPGISRIFDRLFGTYSDQNVKVNELYANSPRKRIKLSGSFQDFSYFDRIQNATLTLSSPTLKFNPSQNEGILGIHVRRGDFLSQKIAHGCLTAQWYHQAISSLLSSTNGINKLRIYSNDDAWVHKNLLQLCPELSIPIEIMKFDSEEDPAVSFISFANCPYRICSNSTFSLLATKLFPGVSVVPYPYNRLGNFRVLEESSPKDWIRIPSIWED